jgi:hypothetical protein
VLSVSIGMDAIGHKEALREPSVGIAPIFVWCQMSFTTNITSQL